MLVIKAHIIQARSFVRKHFSEKRLLNDIESLYMKLMENGA